MQSFNDVHIRSNSIIFDQINRLNYFSDLELANALP